ncbi:MAG TPA: hypothetical protein VHZ24_11400 [Pirellulales bacterium]|jgi:hypothetical protein|nr:hypothetical protein [Pirellulales bacterium]
MPAAVTPFFFGGLDFAPPANEEVRGQVWALLAGMYPQIASVERRRDQRFPFPRLLLLTPVELETFNPIGPTVTAAGKHISESGIGFFHNEPLPYRWVIASIETGERLSLGFLVDVSWCRFTRQGWYESGGRFQRAVAATK